MARPVSGVEIEWLPRNRCAFRGHTYQVPGSARGSLLRRTRIPKAFFDDARYEEQVYLLKGRLPNLHQLVAWTSPDGSKIENFTYPGIIPVTTREFGSAVADLLLSQGLTPSQCHVTGNDLVIRLLGDKPFDALPGDAFRLGIDIKNNQVGFGDPVTVPYLWRMGCTNDATLDKTVGAVVEMDAGIPTREKLRDFLRKSTEMMCRLQEKSTYFGSLIRHAGERRLNRKQFMRAWRQVRSAVHDAEQADWVMRVRTSERVEIDKACKRTNRLLNHGRLNLNEEPTPWSAYEIGNNITERARQLDIPVRFDLETIGGRLITASLN
ncbi:MAG: hypothetical protein FJ222_12775 [Lentisphaerae bacterium]|nr:hypothetical protein [Lentisphaerota bacterium]